MELNTHLTQDSEKIKEDPGEGQAAAGPAVASLQEVSQQMSNNTCEWNPGMASFQELVWGPHWVLKTVALKSLDDPLQSHHDIHMEPLSGLNMSLELQE